MSNKLWAPLTWELFHVIVEKMKEESVPYIKHIIIHIITIICDSLPCPNCREHASATLKRYKHYNTLVTKNNFKHWVFDFHNIVNRRINKPIQPYSCLEKYKTYNLPELYKIWSNQFVIKNHDLQIFTSKQSIARTKNRVYHLLRVHQNHFT